MKPWLAILFSLFIVFSVRPAFAQDAQNGTVATIDAGTVEAGSGSAAVATTPTVAPEVADTTETDAREAYDDVVTGKNYARALASLTLIGIVLFIRRKGMAAAMKALPTSIRTFLAPASAFLATDRGGVAITLGLSFLGAVGHALLTSAAINLALFEAAAMVAIGAIGGYAGLRRLLWPKA